MAEPKKRPSSRKTSQKRSSKSTPPSVGAVPPPAVVEEPQPADDRREMIALLDRIVGAGPLPPELQRQALEMFAALMAQEPAIAPAAVPEPAMMFAAGPPLAETAAAERRLVYVHGICRHDPGYSDDWWGSLHPYVPTAFGAGDLGVTRLEVVWSDIVNRAAVSLRGAESGRFAAPAAAASRAVERDRDRAAEEIKETLRDRADRQAIQAAPRTGPFAAQAPAASSLITIPGASCIDDFSLYLVDDAIRGQIVGRFLDVVRPELQAGRELDVIAHSWGTVVAYEGLRQLEDEGLRTPLVRDFFTAGAALSIGAVKLRLRAANRDGRRPANVRRWVNLDARGDIVGGPLLGRPYAVDFDLVDLDPVGCRSFLGLVNPECAHGSYFVAANIAVNRDVFARFINWS